MADNFSQEQVQSVFGEFKGILGPSSQAMDEYVEPIAALSAFAVRNDGGNLAVSQAFTGDGEKITGCAVLLSRFGNPTGDIVCEIWDSTGTYGTDARPTGTADITSDPLDAINLTTTAKYYVFNFQTELQTVAGTKYQLVIQAPDGTTDVSNNLQVSHDSSGTHDGNESWSTTAGVWTSGNTNASGNTNVDDFLFKILSGSHTHEFSADNVQSVFGGFSVVATDEAAGSDGAIIGTAEITADLDVTVSGGGSFIDFTSQLEGNATVDSDVQVDKQFSSDIEGNATVDSNLQIAKSLSSDIEGNATVDSNLTGVKQVASDLEGNATLDSDAQIVRQLASDVEGNATIDADIQVSKQLASNLDASAVVDADIQGTKQVASDIEGNATVDADLTVESPGAPSFIDLDASIEGNATIDADLQISKPLASDLDASATVDSSLTGIKQVNADIEGNATVDANIQVSKQRLAQLEGNATISANMQVVKQVASDLDASASLVSDVQVDKQLASGIEGNATIDADLDVTVAGGAQIDLTADLEGNATITGDTQVDHQISSNIEGNATILATLSLVEEAIEEVTKGGWLPKEEVRKLLKIRRDLDKKVRDQRKQKDEEQQEQQRELERVFNEINGIEAVSEELAEVVEPFIESVPETAQDLESQPTLPRINFEALAAQKQSADRLRELADRLDQNKQDEEDAIAMLLLM
jgi:hypothetical protein